MDLGSLTPGTGGASPPSATQPATDGAALGSSFFFYGGTHTVTVSSGTKTIAGSISDYYPSSTFVKAGAGTLVLSASNTFFGPIFVNAGTLRVNGSLPYSSAIVVSNGATLNVVGSVNTITNNGLTTISGSAQNVTVNSGGTLNGSGSVLANLTINDGGTLSPGASPGTLTANSANWNGAGNYNWQIHDAAGASGVGSDLLIVNGTLNLSGANGFKINLWTLSSTGPDANGNALNFTNTQARSWTIVHTTGGIAGFNPANFIINTGPTNGTGGFANLLGSGMFRLSVVGNDLMLNFFPSPILTLTPTSVTSNSATLSAAAFPDVAPATAWFQWGLGTNLNQSTSFTNLAGGNNVALRFNGSNAVVNVPSNAAPLGGSEYTIEAWVNPDVNGQIGIIGWGAYGVQNQVNALRFGSNALVNYWWADDLSGPITNPAGQWHHVAATYSGVVLRTIYLDGTNVASDFPAVHSVPYSTNLTIGKTFGLEYFQGRINEVRVWNVSRTQAAIQSQMNFPLTGQEAGLVGYWPLHDGSGGVALDATSHGYNGSLAGSTNWQSASDQPLALPFSLPLSNLEAGVTYSCRVVVSNTSGVFFGNTVSLTTVPVSVRTLIPTSITSTSAMLTASTLINVMPATAWFRWGLGTNLDHVTPVTNVTAGSSSRVALRFNGTNAVVNVLSNAVPLRNSTYTIEAWIYPETNGVLGIIGWGNYGATRQVNAFRLGTNALINYWWAADNTAAISNPAGQWHHVAATYDGASRSVYLDGTLVGLDTSGTNNVPYSTNLTLGKTLGNEYFLGRINEVRVWNIARSQAQLQSAMGLPLSGTESGLVGYWPLHDGAGSVALDGTGHGYAGALSGNPTWQSASDEPVAPIFTLSLANLLAGTVYSCAVVVSNSSGVFIGNTVSFMTVPFTVGTPPVLTGVTKLADGTFQFSFTNIPGAHFTVFGTTNISLPLSNWTIFSNVVEGPAGQFQFTDPQATTNAQRFYRVRSP